MDAFDVHLYRSRFRDALRSRYNNRTFDDAFRCISTLFQPVTSGDSLLNVDHVMAIFDSSLPYCEDWARPDRQDLTKRMGEAHAGDLIKRLGGAGYSRELITKIWRCFRDLGLTSLVLQHVYPDRFAMCSHHLASQLAITGPTVPEFYLRYCEELKDWADRPWPAPLVAQAAVPSTRLNVVDVEFALWTWYRLSYIDGPKQERRRHRQAFYRDPWIQERRARRISQSLGSIGKLALARSYLHTEPTVAAMIAWRELEVTMRSIIVDRGDCSAAKRGYADLVCTLPASAFSRALTKNDVLALWRRRNQVMHEGKELAEDMESAREYAARVLDGVTEFIARNRGED